jgi:hypothetical protein
MEQEKLAALVKLIMSDPRIMALIENRVCECGELTLIETRDLFESLPFEWRSNVFCQELPEGGSGLISCDAALKGDWKQIRFYQPSLNAVAKLAVGIADEPALKLIQDRFAAGADNVELVRLSSVAGIKAEAYRKLFIAHLEKIRSFGAKVSEDGFTAVDRDFPTAVKTRKVCPETGSAIVWQYKALTEKDLLDIDKGSILTVGRKCIVTSLAVDMARRKSIQICREGEVK